MRTNAVSSMIPKKIIRFEPARSNTVSSSNSKNLITPSSRDRTHNPVARSNAVSCSKIKVQLHSPVTRSNQRASVPLECHRLLATTLILCLASIVQLSSSSNQEVQQPTSVKHPRIVDFDNASLDSISRPISISISGSNEIKTPKRLN